MHTTNGTTPAPGVPETHPGKAPERIAMDMIAPYGVYKNGVCVGEYGTEAEAESHFQRLRNPCTNCRDNFPLPVGPLDFFDTQVVNDYTQRRTACTLCPAGDKPCLPKGGAA